MQLANKQSGITLIEMMIAMILGLLVTGTILTIFVSNVKSSVENTRMIHLNQELRTVVGFMADELKRAGYSADPTISDFIDGWNTSTAGCVLYAYDVNGDGALDVSGAENFGFRLNNQEIKWGTDADACSDITQPITDVNTARISTFTLTPSTITTSGSVQVRHLEVVIVGETDLNPDTASRRIEETIRVRNEDAD